jgi:hypothetical protein
MEAITLLFRSSAAQTTSAILLALAPALVNSGVDQFDGQPDHSDGESHGSDRLSVAASPSNWRPFGSPGL